MRVAGIDPSTKTGMAFIHPDGIDTKIVTFPKKTGMDRLQSIAKSVRNILNEWQPDLVVVEGYAYGNAHTLVILVEIGTLIRQAIYESGLKWCTVPPTTVKKFATGSGSASKGVMAKSVQEKWGFVSKSDDVVDAYALARIGMILGTESASSLKGVIHGCSKLP